MLRGVRLTLRPVTRDDLPRYVIWLNDPQVNLHLSARFLLTLDDETDWYERQRQDQSVINLAIETETGEHIGSVSLMNINRPDQSAELGIVIGAKEAWNKGYGGEAIDLILDYGFNYVNLNRIYLRVDADHPAAIKCYQRAGFVTEGELREAVFRAGAFQSQYLMSILRREYGGQEKE